MRVEAVAGLGLMALAVACGGKNDEALFGSQTPPGPTASAPAIQTATCAGRCGGASADKSCACDAQCAAAGDCCADYESVCAAPPAASGGAGGAGGTGGESAGGASGGSAGQPGSGGAPTLPENGSCQGMCGGAAPDQSCWCDAACTDYGDCCGDFAAACPAGGVGPNTGCTPALCQSGMPAYENGSECYCDAACTDYGDCCSNKPSACN
ncbi:MAG: hypothetical protein KC776_09990 [Myxococcales bacterium]|nr:hypothetical protein [Myxococcales bacterium]MCB9582627.1 hypothetical protein [Polyangiaceae bacterium]